MSNLAIELKNIRHTFYQGEQTLEVLKGVSLHVQPGEIVALMGPSGAGKSTLLQIAGLLEHPTSGDIFIEDKNVSGLDDIQRSTIRRDSIGFVYQFHHLLPEFSALENIVLPLLNKGIPLKDARLRAEELLGTLGLSARASHRPARLSGGEQQRVAILRAIANGPKILLADEPTGNLDPETAEVVFSELIKLVRKTKMGALVATHNPELAKRMDRVLYLSTKGLEER
jgi:lipoprotein-releasing system ATP-binding protein